MKRKILFWSVLAVFLSVSLLFLASCQTSSGDVEEVDNEEAVEENIVDDTVYPLRLSTHFTPNDPPGQGITRLAELIESKSEGRITVEIFWSSELGNERENAEMVHDGSIEMTTSLPAGAGAWVPQTAIVEFPYLYKDDAHMFRVMKAVSPDIEEILAPYGFKPLGVINVGFRHILTQDKPIYTVADLKGLKIRVPNPFYAALFNHLGATATQLPWGDIYMGLQTGVIDAMEASPALIYSMKFHEQANYLSKTNHIAAVIVYLTNKDWFDSLPEDLQAILVEAADEASEYQFELQAQSNETMLQMIADEGIEINEVNDINEFVEACISFREQYVKEQGPEWEELYNKMISVE